MIIWCRISSLTPGEDPEAQDSLHQPAAAGAGEAVQGEQVPLQA